MASTIKLKNGSGAPTSGQLVQGEPAFDLTNKRLYTENASGTVIEVGTNPSSLTIGGTALTATAAELNTLDGITATTAELNTLDGITATVTELNYTDGVTSNIQTQLNTKAPIASPTFTGTVTAPAVNVNGTVTADGIALGDNDKATFGASDDLQIYHDGTHSYIADTGTGNLYISGASQIRLTDDTGSIYFAGIKDAQSQIYYDGAVKLATTSTGIDVTGTVTADGLTVDGVSAFNGGNVSLDNAFYLSWRNSANTADITSITFDSSDTLVLDPNRYGAVIGTSANPSLKVASNRDISFYEDTGTTAKFFWDASAESLGIGTTSPAYLISANSAAPQIGCMVTGTSALRVAADGLTGYIYEPRNVPLTFATNSTERARLDASGNLLVGNTIANPASGFSNQRGFGYTNSTGKVEIATTANDAVIEIGKNNANDGALAIFRKQGTVVGSIGSIGGNAIFINSVSTGKLQANGSDRYAWDTSQFYPTDDNLRDLGFSTFRWDDVYATNGTINTSDRNEKQDIEALSDAEQRVAVACKGLLRKFRWKSSVAENGDEARIHFGIVAQDLQAAFEAEGLDAGRYAMFISTTWTDEETGEERTRMGVRYSELLAFIIAAI